MTRGDGARGAARRRGVRIAGAGLWAIMDQGLFALANFGMNVLLARLLGLEAYGIFSLAFAVFLFVSTAHTAVVTEPLLVLGTGRYRDRLATYVRAVIAGHWWLMRRGILPALVVSFVVWLQAPALGVSLLALTAAAPLVLLQWMLRRACYVELRPSIAALAGGLYLVVVIAGVYALHAVGLLSAATGLLLMGFASGVSVLVILRYLSTLVDRSPVRRSDASFARHIRREHWDYGRWGVAAIMLAWASVEIYYLFLSALEGFDATGVLRAAMNLVAPVMQSMLALSTVALPLFGRANREGRLRRTVALAYAAFGALATLFAVALIVFTEPIVLLLYGPDYLVAVPVVRIVALVPLTVAVTRVAASALHALERPRDIYLGYLPGGIVALTLGVVLTWHWGVSGAAVGVLLSGVAVASAMGRRLRIAAREAAQ